MAPSRIALYGVFGIQNLGNECTLYATLENLRTVFPGTDVFCIGADPKVVKADYGIDGAVIDPTDVAAPIPVRRGGRIAKAWRVLVSHAPHLVADFARMLRTVGRGTTLSITGTGVLEADTATPNWLVRMLMWSLAARLRGGRVVFVSIGTDRASSRLNRWLLRAVLRGADYVSYRDRRSMACMAADGVDTRTHHVYPDLAFSLPRAVVPAAELPRPVPAHVGVGVVDMTKFPDTERYVQYLRQLAEFIGWLIDRGLCVTLLHGDGKYDAKALADLWRELELRGIRRDDARIRAPLIRNTGELMRELAGLDIVIASRFHNIILSMLLGRPAIALSYHFKFAALMEEFSMERYCIELPDFNLEWLTQRFVELSFELGARARAIADAAAGLRPALEQQYRKAFLTSGGRAAE
jgi:polysaccharide pyruvyl transferase WcaK-like protein